MHLASSGCEQALQPCGPCFGTADTSSGNIARPDGDDLGAGCIRNTRQARQKQRYEQKDFAARNHDVSDSS
jgi:hypothetical protein